MRVVRWRRQARTRGDCYLIRENLLTYVAKFPAFVGNGVARMCKCDHSKKETLCDGCPHSVDFIHNQDYIDAMNLPMLQIQNLKQ